MYFLWELYTCLLNTGKLTCLIEVMHGFRKFCQRGSNSDNVFFSVLSFSFLLVDEGRTEDLYNIKAGHHRPTSETPFI